ncbi:MAG: hypothetical protein ACPLKS_06110 [Caldisericum exile]|uniref:hypothetical protein n=1 Tax=Caldisericum exile TaxID=693075 RepID=UPI003C76DDDB
MSEYNPLYCNIDLVKERLLIDLDDRQYDNALNNAVAEASRLVDIFLRAYTTVPLTKEDMSTEERIINGGFETGDLSGWEYSEYDGASVVSYDKNSGNYSCELAIDGYIKQTFATPIPKSSISTFTLYRKRSWLMFSLALTLFYSDGSNSVIYIDGTDDWTQYDALNDVANKDLVAIQLIGGAGCGSGTMLVDDVSLVATVKCYPYEIQQITADFAASIFKRRMMPEDVNLRGALQPDQINQIDATGWFSLGIAKLERYIKSKYVIQDKPLTTTLYNPDVYIELFNRGIITAAEVREFTGQEVVIKDVRETYEYRRQKKFKVIAGVEDEDGYEVLD